MPRRKKAAAGTVGLSATEVAEGTPPSEVAALQARIEGDGGRVLARYRDPYGAQWLILAALPLDRVAATPYQRELSESHVKQLASVIPKVGRFLDPIVVVPENDGYWTPNGMHRLESMKMLGARAIIGLVVPEPKIALRILALNTEKAHNLKDKSLEVMRMERGLAQDAAFQHRPESEWAFEFEEPAYLTIGLCYDHRPRFAGAVYLPVLKRCEEFIDGPLQKAFAEREARAATVLELDDAVAACVDALRKAGLVSPYLKAFVVARINPLRFVKAPRVGVKAPKASFEATFGKMLQKAQAFDASKIRPQDLSGAGGPPAEE